MMDLSQIDTFDDWLFDPNETVTSDANYMPSLLPPSPPVLASNESTLPVTRTSETVNNGEEEEEEEEEENVIKKRKYQHKTDSTEHKKSKQAPSYMRRNIRHLFTNDKLQDNTLSALKAEQDRLKRLEEINDNYEQFTTVYNHMPIHNYHQYKQTPNEQECIVLDDDDENEQDRLARFKMNSDTSRRPPSDALDDDGNDSDIQYVDEDGETVTDNLTKKLQRLHVDDRINIPDENGDILINISHPSDDPDLYILKHLCAILKPHQIGGTRFMYDNIVESLERFQTTAGLGCILAHSMGCGKTLQVITFIDILLRHTTAKSVLVVVPINTIQNWASEFNRWCPCDDPTIQYRRPYQLYILNEASKKLTQRAKLVQNWSQSGGALIIGYEMFRLMVIRKGSQANTSTKMNNNQMNRITNISIPTTNTNADVEEEDRSLETMEDIRNALINPDLVICDEGHRIKNHQAGVAIALKSIKTQRRIVLTGYPLQNNLIEYWCMVDFVRPNYLGSRKEFCNMFERPILNGQCVDSTAEDRQLMRARAHVLHSLLEGFIQRRGHDVLQIDLPPKTEYVILLKLTSIQRQLYMKFLEAVGALSNSSERTLNPLRAFAICCKIWNHPDALYKFVRDRQDGSDLDFDLEIEQNSNPTNRTLTAKSRSTNHLAISNRSSPVPSPQTTMTNQFYEHQTSIVSTEKKEFDYDFANSILNSYTCGQLANGIKFEMALTIIDLSIKAGDKVLLFSQSLLSLNKLEEFLHQRQIPDTEQQWEKNISYYRLDGATNSLERERLINAFNAPYSNAKLFLLSTRAGCLGINLIAANRVIVMDVSWNPCLDAQAICRVYRYGQEKHCYIYRLIADFTMEKRIYDRQITKQGMSNRVVDELQPQNQFTRNEVANLIHFAAVEEPAAIDLLSKIDQISNDLILSDTCRQYAQSITKIPFTHESLLSDQKDCQLTSAEKRRAQKHYQHEKRMNTHSNRSRFTPSRSHSSFTGSNNNTNHAARYLNELMQRSSYPPPPPPPPSSTFDSRHSSFNNYPSLSPSKIERLKQQGVSVRAIQLQQALEVQLSVCEREVIPVGAMVYLIKSPRGSFVRTLDGKFFAIRQSAPAAASNPKPRPIAPQPPLPPPPPPTSSSLLEELLLNTPVVRTSNSAASSSINDLNDELDQLIDDINSDPAPSSAFANLNSWQNNYFQHNHMYSGLFQDPSSLSIPSSINSSNSLDHFLANPMPFL